jgi:hypothetical protein
MGRPVVVYSDGETYIFTSDGVYMTEEKIRFGPEFKGTLCLVDGDVRTPPPDYLMQRSPLFVLMAASPRRRTSLGSSRDR